MIYFENLSLQVGDRTLLTQQTKAIVQGQVVGLIGRNGVGKSTFLKTLAGILPPLQGHIFFHRRSLETYSAQELSRLRGFIPADPLCFWSLKVKDIMNGFLLPQWGQALDIAPLWERSFTVLSSGEKARVMLASQLVRQVKILILDEILSHLDDRYQIIVMELLSQFAQSQGAVLLALHQVELAHLYCHQVWEIDNQALHLKKIEPPVLKDIQSL